MKPDPLYAALEPPVGSPSKRTTSYGLGLGVNTDTQMSFYLTSYWSFLSVVLDMG